MTDLGVGRGLEELATALGATAAGEMVGVTGAGCPCVPGASDVAELGAGRGLDGPATALRVVSAGEMAGVVGVIRAREGVTGAGSPAS